MTASGRLTGNYAAGVPNDGCSALKNMAFLRGGRRTRQRMPR